MTVRFFALVVSLLLIAGYLVIAALTQRELEVTAGGRIESAAAAGKPPPLHTGHVQRVASGAWSPDRHSAGLASGGQLLAGGLVPPIGLPPAAVEPPGHWRASSHPHGRQMCASGCTLSNHPTSYLSLPNCRRLLEQYQLAATDQESEPLDALLYYGPQTLDRLRDKDLAALLDREHLDFLRRELERSRVIVSFRVSDDEGRVRIQLPPTSVPQHVRQVFSLDVTAMAPAVCSGTVKRVGLNYVWQRL